MTKARRKYSREYKQEAVTLVQQSNQPISHVAKSLGLNDTMLRRWIKEFSEPTKTAFPGNGTPRDEEVARLKRELAEVKRERDFLREAAAYFAKHPK
jgi:transposase